VHCQPPKPNVIAKSEAVPDLIRETISVALRAIFVEIGITFTVMAGLVRPSVVALCRYGWPGQAGHDCNCWFYSGRVGVALAMTQVTPLQQTPSQGKHFAGFPKIGERQAFGESGMDRLQEATGFGWLALAQPETREADTRLQLEQPRRLVSRDIDRVFEFRFRGGGVSARTGCQHRGFPAPGFGVECRRSRARRHKQGLVQQPNCLRLSTGPCEGIRHQAVDIRSFPPRPQ
jgi:hypothetical protein